MPERQQVAEVGVELVFQAVGSDSLIEFWIIPVQKRRRLIVGRRPEERGIDIQDLSPGVIGFETQSATGALDE